MLINKKYVQIGILIIVFLFLIFLIRFISLKIAIGKIQKQDKITILMRNTPTIYYQGAEGPTGFEYEMMSDFADYVGVEMEIKVLNNISSLLSAIKNGDGDIASGAITKTKERNDSLLFGPKYYEVNEVIVYKRGQKKPKNIDGLSNCSLVVKSKTSYIKTLKDIQKKHPTLKWIEEDKLSTEQLLYKISKGRLDFTVADENIFDINRRYFPGLRIAFPISENQDLSWVVNNDKKYFKRVLKHWFRKYRRKGKLELLIQKHFGYSEIYDFVDIRAFHRKIKSTLPKYKNLFIKIAKKYDISWQLLASQAYQESHWNPYAKSPTGVRGMMMLTRNTAKSLGVTNRINATQSINGGAKYLSKMLSQVPDNVNEEDKILFALAGYNVGMAHIKDAIILADNLNIGTSNWNEFKEVLPLLTQEKYYKKLKYGYARGTEPVIYVERILNYKNILENK